MTDLTSLDPRCKICALMRTENDLWKELHRRIFIEGRSHRQTRIWLNQRVEDLNASRDEKNKLPTFGKPNFTNHFSNHLTSFTQVEAYISAANLFSPEAKLNPAKAILQATGKDMEDFLRLEALITAVENQLSTYEKSLSAGSVSGPGGASPRPVDLKEVKEFQKLVQQQMQMKTALAALQNKKSVAGSALREALERVVDVVMNAMSDSMVELRSNLHQQFASPKLADELTRMVRYGIGEPLKSAVPKIHEEVCLKYKIR